MGITQEIASYVAGTHYRDIPGDVIQLARGFILDGLGVALAGSTDECARIVQRQIRQTGGSAECSVLGTSVLAPAGMLSELSGGLDVTIRDAGLLITFGAIVLCIGSPLTAWPPL